MSYEVTVFVPVYNGETYLEIAVNSALNQTLDCVKVVILDNCSTDSSPTIAKGLADKHEAVFYRRNEENLGIVGNFNRALEVVDTKYHMILCADDRFARDDALQLAYDAMEADPELPAVFSDLGYITAEDKTLLTRTFKRSGKIPGASTARRSILNTRNFFSIPVLNRSSMGEGYRFNTNSLYALDLDYAIYLTKDSYFYHIPEVLIFNRYHQGNLTRKMLWDAKRNVENVALNHGLPLSGMDRFIMGINHVLTVTKKMVFFKYLDWKS